MNIKNLLLFLIIIILLIFLKTLNTPPDKYYLHTYTVQTGDTAWDIAKKYNTANMDIRELIYYIEEDNNIKAGYLKNGQEIKIRIYRKD